MAIKVECSCGKRIAVEDKLAGQHVNCPSCNQPLSVPCQDVLHASPSNRVANEFVEVARLLAKDIGSETATSHRPAPTSQLKINVAILGIAALVCVAIPLYATFVELAYSYFGKTVAAQVTRKSHQWRGRGVSLVILEYSFQEATGLTRNERDELPGSVSINSEQPLTVEYIPGFPGFSRVERSGSRLATLWMVYGFTALAWGGGAWFAWVMRFNGPSPKKRIPVRQAVSI